MVVKIVLSIGVLLGITAVGNAQLLSRDICPLIACLGWCGCNGSAVTVSNINGDILFRNCGINPEYGYDVCTNDTDTAVIGDNQRQVKACQQSKGNPLIFFRTEISETNSTVRVWDENNFYILNEYCLSECNRMCGITTVPNTPSVPPLTTASVPKKTRLIDEILPRFTPPPTNASGPLLSLSDMRQLGIAVGAFVAGLVICVIVVCICLRRSKARKRRPSDDSRVNDNRDYATIEETQMSSFTRPVRLGGVYPNALYRSESIAEDVSQNERSSFHRSLPNFELLGDPPQPPARQTSLLPGINPALADSSTDGRTAPLDSSGYAVYMPDSPTPPYMRLKVKATLSDPMQYKQQAPPHHHRYRSNTSDTHARVEDIDRIVDRIRAREALSDSRNREGRRFVQNNSGRNSGLRDEIHRVNRSGRKPVPRSKKNSANAFTPMPVCGLYQSRSRKSQESMRKWKSLPDMAECADRSTRYLTFKSENNDANAPFYHLLNPSPASTVGDYTKTAACEQNARPNGGPNAAQRDPLKSPDNSKRSSRRTKSESNPATARHPVQTDFDETGPTDGDRYDTVYEHRGSAHLNGKPAPDSSTHYTPLAMSSYRQEPEFDDDAYQSTESLLENGAYLQPNRIPPFLNGNSLGSGGRNGNSQNGALVPNGGHVQRSNSKNNTCVTYKCDNNNLSPKTMPTRTASDSSYMPLNLKPIGDSMNDAEDDSETDEYHPAGPHVEITAL